MSRAVENALQKVQNTQFRFIDNRTLEVQNAVILWPNFRGEKDKFGNSTRLFNLAVTPEMANQLSEMGWRIREFVTQDDEHLYFIKVKVNILSNYPPKVMLYIDQNGKKSVKQLVGDQIGELDRIDIKDADCILSAYESQSFPGKVTGYLKSLHVIQEVDTEFGGKYDDWADDDSIIYETPEGR